MILNWERERKILFEERERQPCPDCATLVSGLLIRLAHGVPPPEPRFESHSDTSFVDFSCPSAASRLYRLTSVA